MQVLISDVCLRFRTEESGTFAVLTLNLSTVYNLSRPLPTLQQIFLSQIGLSRTDRYLWEVILFPIQI